jgi:hypothetical protein
MNKYGIRMLNYRYVLLFTFLACFVLTKAATCSRTRYEEIARLEYDQKPSEFFQNANKLLLECLHESAASEEFEEIAMVIDDFIRKSNYAAEANIVVGLQKKSEVLTVALSKWSAVESVQSNGSARVLLDAARTFVNELASRSITNFVPRQVYVNVPLPPGVFGTAGGSPKAIKDPDQRAMYEAAIQENNRNSQLNQLQYIVATAQQSLRSSFRIFASIALAKGFIKEEEASQILSRLPN